MPYKKESYFKEAICSKCGTAYIMQNDSHKIKSYIIASTGGIITDPTIVKCFECVKCGCIIFI